MLPLSSTRTPYAPAEDRRGALTGAFAAVAGALAVLAVVLTALTAPAGQVGARVLLEALIVGLPLSAGVYAIRSSATALFGLLTITAGLAWSLTALATSDESLAYTVGRVAGWLVFPPLFYLILSFPSGRLRARLDRRLFLTLFVVDLVLFIGVVPFVSEFPAQTPWSACGTDCPPNAFQLVEPQPAVIDAVVRPVRELLTVILFGAATFVLIRRWRASGPIQRRAVRPVLLMAMVSSLTLCAFMLARRAAPGSDAVDTLAWIWALTLPALSGAFLVGLVRRSITVGHVLSRLSAVPDGPVDVRSLCSRLARVLGDPSVDVLVPSDAPGRWLDSSGRERTKPPTSEHLTTTPVEDGTGAVAVLVHDPALREEKELVDAVRAIVLTTVRHEQLMHRLEGSLKDLEESRNRVARAADLERSRIERDLHDGAQQRLIGLRIRLGIAQELAATDPVEGARAFNDLGGEVELALEELRSLAQGVYPALLADRGLEDALGAVRAGAPLPIRLVANDIGRYPQEIETAVYFTCVEAVQNVIKHANGAGAAWISLWQTDRLRFEVRDDGGGFVPTRDYGEGGLRNMHDRIEAVGGRIVIDSAPGRGTRVRGSVPLD